MLLALGGGGGAPDYFFPFFFPFFPSFSFLSFLSHRARAARDAMRVRWLAVSALARARPPLSPPSRPSAAAWGFFRTVAASARTTGASDDSVGAWHQGQSGSSPALRMIGPSHSQTLQRR